MTWEEIGYSVYLAGVVFLAMRVKLPNPLPWRFELGAVIGAVIWPVLLLNNILGIGVRR